MELYEKTLSVQPIYDGRIIHAHVDDVELGNGAVTKREVVDHPGGVSVAVLTEKNELIFVRQFRYPYRKVLLELPAGKLETGEDPFEAMKREQLEETGTKGESYVSLGEVYPTPGYCGEIIRLWACRRTERQQELHLDEDEFLDVVTMPFGQLVEQVMDGTITDGKTVSTTLKVKVLLGL